MTRTPALAAAASAAAVSALLLAAAPAASPSGAPGTPAESKPARDARMKWWRDARFGMFIHFGLYSQPAGVWAGKDWPGAGEWLLHNAKADPIEYEKTLLPTFNPVKFDAKEWADLARDAGMKYVVITTKHHDGFALWDSKVSDYDVMATPFKRDIMKELSDAVRADGLTMCWYHSIMDWHHPDYLPRREWDKRPADAASYPRYVEYMNAQLRELLMNYGPIGILWFDGEWENTWNHDLGKRTDDFVRSLQPTIIVNNRVDTGRAGMEGFSADEKSRGDYGTPEQTIPPNGMPGRDWETCMTMNGTWGFKLSDTRWKSAQDLIRKLCDIASKGGNFLLNVGPRGDGTVPPESVERLHRMGAWMKMNGDAIYGTTASPFPRTLPWGRVTCKPGVTAGTAETVLNLFVFDWPKDGTLRLDGLRSDPMGVTVLGDAGRKATAARDDRGVVVTGLGAAPVDADATVVQLRVAGTPQVDPVYVLPAANGTVTCRAADAVTTGSIQYESHYENLGWWRDTASTASWEIKVAKAIGFRVALEYACNETCGGEIEVDVGGTKLKATLPPRKDWGDFATVEVGTATIPADTPVRVTVRALTKPGESFINLRSVTLTPMQW